MSVDSQHSVDQTDRKEAFRILSESIERVVLPIDAQLFGHTTRYEPAPLAEALSEELLREHSAEMVVPFDGDPAEWDIDAWALAPVVARWGARGRPVILLVNEATLAAADAVTRRRFVLWAQHARATIRAVDPERLPSWLAAVIGSKSTTAWSSTAEGTRKIGPSWAAASEAPIVRGAISRCDIGQPVELGPLLASGNREALLEITAELDGPVSGFGMRLREMLARQSPELRGVISAKFQSLTYSDRYLFSPLSVRLVTELLAGFADETTEIKVVTLAARPDGRPPRGRWTQSDWPDLSTRSLLLGHMLAHIAPRSSVETLSRLGHKRRLDFKTEKGAGAIFFDQGVGSWSATSRTEYDHSADHAVQIEAIRAPMSVTNSPEGTYVAIKLSD